MVFNFTQAFISV